MTVSIIAKNASQKITGSTVAVTGIVLQTPALTAFTCPTGQIVKIHVFFTVDAWNGVGKIARIKIAGFNVLELTEAVGEPFTTDMGIFVITSGQTVQGSTKNSGTEGAEVTITTSVLQETPQ